MRPFAVVGFFALWASLVTYWAVGITQPADAEAAGLYKKRCQACHGADGAGNPGMAKILKVEFKHLGSAEIQEKSDEELKVIIVEGVGKMKPVKGISEGDMAAVIAHTRTLKLE